MLSSYEQQAEEARREQLSCEQYLAELMEREREERREKRIGRLLRESRLPLEKNLRKGNRGFYLSPIGVRKVTMKHCCRKLPWFGHCSIEKPKFRVLFKGP